MSSKTLRCAIYTRKSSEEGLDQSFNSLDAQRDAGEAYIASQAHEGWTLLPARYDDGGFSGGTLERPGLQRLLADIEAGLVDVVVVYKIDRLTRSLTDFSRIIEVFDRAGTSFVSVTQSFNTTDSMGRLMLNVLLSFAQFEREVTGERIRDKIAASKAKGMWMGGNLPLGYDLPAAGTRTLQVNENEAKTVRHIYQRYLALGSVHALQRDVSEQGLYSKRHTTRSGKDLGGLPFSRGALFHLLRNRIYLGQIVHRDVVHQGEHQAIVPQELFDLVQQKLGANARRHRAAAAHRVVKAPLTGKLFDADGEPMSPSFSRGKSGRAYRYYVSTRLQRGSRGSEDNILRRLPASVIERVVGEAVTRWRGQSTPTLQVVRSVRLVGAGLAIEFETDRANDVALHLDCDERVLDRSRKHLTILLPLAMPLRGGSRFVVAGSRSSSRPDAKMIAALRKAHRMLGRDGGMPMVIRAPVSIYDRRVLRLAFLAPDIQRDIMAGRQPPSLNLERLIHTAHSIAWTEQRRALGWPAPK